MLWSLLGFPPWLIIRIPFSSRIIPVPLLFSPQSWTCLRITTVTTLISGQSALTASLAKESSDGDHISLPQAPSSSAELSSFLLFPTHSGKRGKSKLQKKKSSPVLQVCKNLHPCRVDASTTVQSTLAHTKLDYSRGDRRERELGSSRTHCTCIWIAADRRWACISAVRFFKRSVLCRLF